MFLGERLEIGCNAASRALLGRTRRQNARSHGRAARLAMGAQMVRGHKGALSTAHVLAKDALAGAMVHGCALGATREHVGLLHRLKVEQVDHLARRCRLLQSVLGGRGGSASSWAEARLPAGQLVVEVVVHLQLLLTGHGLVRDQVGLMELLLRYGLAQAVQVLHSRG